MYNALKRLIEKRYFGSFEIAQHKIDVFYANNRLSDDEYVELSNLVKTIYLS